MTEAVHILWTGGMDSTFLVLRSLLEGKRVVPVYVLMVDTRHIAEKRVMGRVKKLFPESFLASMQETITLYPEQIVPIVNGMRAGLSDNGVSFGSHNHQISLNSVWQAAGAKYLETDLYSGCCADDRCRGWEWQETNGVKMPLRQVRKSEMVVEAHRNSWIPILRETVSCIRTWESNCGQCVECQKRRKAGML